MKGRPPVQSYVTEVWKTFRLAIPMILGQLVAMTMHLIDVAMVGRLEGEQATVSQAALGFTGQALFAFMAAGFGLCIAVSVLSAQAFGAGRREDLQNILQHGVLLVLAYGLFIGTTVHFGADALRFLNPPEAVFQEARDYARLIGWATASMLLAAVLRNFSEAQDRPWIPFFCSLTGVCLNVGLNWVLIFGNLGAPALGLRGAGIATLVATIWNFLFLFFVLFRMRSIPLDFGFFNFLQLRIARFRRLLRIGVPSMGQLFIEILAFNLSGIYMVWLGTVAAAAHTIALAIAAFTFMVPLGYSMAISLRTAQAVGQKDYRRVRAIGIGSFVATGMLMAVTATGYFLLHDLLPHLYSTDPAVILLAGQLLIMVAIFQLSDGLQVVALGALRGLEDVNVPLVLVLLSYWTVCLPLGYYLAFVRDVGPIGVWVGLVVGLALAATLITWRFLTLSGKRLREQEVAPAASLEGLSR